MLMLTHTYLLQQMIEASNIENIDPDIYVYNIAPDLLTLHPDISAHQTHSIQRFINAPPEHSRTAYVMFHLLVDDLAHFGKISMEYKEGFHPDSPGYAYVKGRTFVNTIVDLHKMIDHEISYNEAAYQSHLMIEMIYDLVILQRIQAGKSIDTLAEAVLFTREKREAEFCGNMSWLYGVDQSAVRNVLAGATSYLTKERMNGFMNIEGRIRLFIDKFGHKNQSEPFKAAVSSLFTDALNSIEDEEFLQEIIEAVRKSGWQPVD
jgi:hypothetical protein